jgi:hypothetical protein
MHPTTADAPNLLPLAASVLCFIFAAVLFRQWWQRRKPYQLVWSGGLLWYAIAAGADAAGQFVGWSEPTYRAWYLFGAVAAAAWLGLGEVYLFRTAAFGELVALGVFCGAIPALIRGGRLLGAHEDAAAQTAIGIGMAGIAAAGVLAYVAWERPDWLGHTAAAILGVATLVAAGRVVSAPIDATAMVDPATGIPHGGGFPEYVRLMTPLFNIGGALALLFGAAYSAWGYWRRRAHVERVVSNCLIVLGAFAPSLTGSLNRFGVTEVFYWGELLGVVLIFAGFLANHEVIARRLQRDRLLAPPLAPAPTAGAVQGRYTRA